MDREAAFLDSIDFRFPYSDPVAQTRLLAEAATINSNCVIALVLEVVRPPPEAVPAQGLMTKFLDSVAARLPANELASVVAAARDHLMGQPLSLDRARVMLGVLEQMDGEYSALSVVSRIVEDRGFDEIDARENQIRATWRSRLRRPK